MPAYDETHSPPAAVVDALIHRSSSHVVPIRAFIDTGADWSIVPRELARGRPIAGHVSIRGFKEEPKPEMAFELDVEVDGYKRSLIVTRWDENYMLLGRDFLNEVVLELNGPALIFTIR
jgi:hypothetical protein